MKRASCTDLGPHRIMAVLAPLSRHHSISGLVALHNLYCLGHGVIVCLLHHFTPLGKLYTHTHTKREPEPETGGSVVTSR